MHERHRVERLLAHRELQLARAMATGDRRYIKRRLRKLEEAKKVMARYG